MGLGDIANLIYKKYTNKHSSQQQAWKEFESNPIIEALNKYVDYPLHSRNFTAFIERLNKLNYDEADEMVLKLFFLNSHEMIELRDKLYQFFKDN